MMNKDSNYERSMDLNHRPLHVKQPEPVLAPKEKSVEEDTTQLNKEQSYLSGDGVDRWKEYETLIKERISTTIFF